MHPASNADLAKLVVWTFIAGCSGKFVPNPLSQPSGSDPAGSPSASGPAAMLEGADGDS
ncbi:hypothetical protein [Cyanobium sp. NIES-981]|uniref:hypothetical protein n=1 Tax=Cyanobium sp. NIES-981 TaxID=1851505 RepID=UPI0007DD591D|nr:hypothetical protein [Cyanobium sp. NIES-981]SBO42064.1 protein of unknown function [Cyanobium sp. NIES-981]